MPSLIIVNHAQPGTTSHIYELQLKSAAFQLKLKYNTYLQ